MSPTSSTPLPTPRYLEVLLQASLPSLERARADSLKEIAILFGDDLGRYPLANRALLEAVFLQLLQEEEKPPAPRRREHLAEMALRLAESAALAIGGSHVYLSKGWAEAMQKAHRDAQIVNEFAGSVSDMARKYGITDMRVRQILAAHRKAKRAAEGAHRSDDQHAPPKPQLSASGAAPSVRPSSKTHPWKR